MPKFYSDNLRAMIEINGNVYVAESAEEKLERRTGRQVRSVRGIF